MRKPIVIDNLALGFLDGMDEHGNWEADEAHMFCREALERCLNQVPSTRAIQEWYLLLLKEICKEASGGKRNEPLEREVSSSYLRHNGVGIFQNPLVKSNPVD